MNTLLVMTVGATDVQLVRSSERLELGGEECSRHHSDIESRLDWSLSPAPEQKSSDKVEQLPTGPFELCTPKLDALLDWVRSQNLHITHALILETRRDLAIERREPRAAGMVLERRIDEVSDKRTKVVREAYLQGRERLENKPDPKGAVVRVEAVKRIDEAVRSIILEASPQQIIIATTGGLAAITSLVDEVVQLHSLPGASIELLEVADGARANPPGKDMAVSRVKYDPSESYRTRRRALELIDKGNFLAAWGAVCHLTGSPEEHHWVRIVEWLAQFAGSMPLSDECDIDELRHPSMAMRVALRVECALRAGDIPRAVHGSVAFYEAAIHDHLARQKIKHPSEDIFALLQPPQPALVRQNSGQRDRPFELKRDEHGQKYYRIHVYDARCAEKIVNSYLTSDPLKDLQTAIQAPRRELRNNVAHSEPIPALMEKAKERMVIAGLWSQDNRFTTQCLIKRILIELGEQMPESCLDSLLQAVRARLLAC